MARTNVNIDEMLMVLNTETTVTVPILRTELITVYEEIKELRLYIDGLEREADEILSKISDPVFPCWYCGDNRNGKGSMIIGDMIFCNDNHYDLYCKDKIGF